MLHSAIAVAAAIGCDLRQEPDITMGLHCSPLREGAIRCALEYLEIVQDDEDRMLEFDVGSGR